MKEKLYEEVGAVYRFFLGWRHASFAGIVVIVAGALSLTASIHKDSPELAFLVPLFASPFGIVLWMIEVRNRELYHAAIKAGKHLEGDQQGFYTILSNEVTLKKGDSPFCRITQAGALNFAFWASSIGLVGLAGFLFCQQKIQRTSRSNDPVPRLSVSGTLTNMNIDVPAVTVPPGTSRSP